MSNTTLTKMDVPDVTGLTPDQRSVLAEIMRDLQASVNRLESAAKKWMELAPGARKKIVDQTNPSFRPFWARLEQVGSGTLHPQLATVGGTAARLLGKLPVEEQGRYLNERLPVVVKPRGAGWDMKLVDVAELSEDQRKQVFRVGRDGTVIVRDEEQQKVYLAEKAARRMVERSAVEHVHEVVRAGWTARGDRVYPNKDLVKNGITKKQLQKMIADLEG